MTIVHSHYSCCAIMSNTFTVALKAFEHNIFNLPYVIAGSILVYGCLVRLLYTWLLQPRPGELVAFRIVFKLRSRTICLLTDDDVAFLEIKEVKFCTHWKKII